MRFILLMISPFVMLLFSCGSKQYINTYSNRIDSLSIVLDESASSLKAIDTAEITQRLEFISRVIIQTESADNIFDKDTVKLIKQLKKTFEEFLLVYPSLNNELVYTKSQLNAFLHDLEKALLSEEKAVLYFEQEKQSVHVLRLKIEYYQELIASNKQRFQLLKTGFKHSTESDIQ